MYFGLLFKNKDKIDYFLKVTMKLTIVLKSRSKNRVFFPTLSLNNFIVNLWKRVRKGKERKKNTF